jgi:subfamily B ATP-binding cassette protein MsbA
LNEKDEKDNKDKRTDLWRAWKRILSYARPYVLRLGIGMVLTVVASVIWLSVPLGVKSLLDSVFEEQNRGLLNLLGWGLLGLFAVQSTMTFFSGYLISWVGERIVTDLRKEIYAHLHRLGLRFYAENPLGDLTSRLTNDVGAVKDAATDDIADALRTFFSLIGSLVVMVGLNWRLSLIVFCAVPPVAIGSRYFGGKIRTLSRKVQDRLADTTAAAEEALSAIRVVKAFAREDFEVKRYQDAVESLFQTSRYRAVMSSLFSSSNRFLFMVAMVVIFWYGGSEVLEGRLSAGDLVAFIMYASTIAGSVMGVSHLYTSLNSAVGASERIFELLDTTPEIIDIEGAGPLPSVNGAVVFENVSFHYDDNQPVLTDISFVVEPGETLALVGPSGAGKTTLMNMIPRFYDATNGEIFVDGADIRSVKVRSLREQIALVSQDVHLFGTSIRENIRYGKLDATDEEVKQAAHDANALEFIDSFADGFDSLVGERGVKLSGGQRQRVAIARAILRDARILLLDEATSALDSASEALVQEALERLMKGRTTFIIAHRLSTVQHANRILVLEAGRLVQMGTHSELFAQDGLYQKLCRLQFRNLDGASQELRSTPTDS